MEWGAKSPIEDGAGWTVVDRRGTTTVLAAAVSSPSALAIPIAAISTLRSDASPAAA
jgi:hypothetical protein